MSSFTFNGKPIGYFAEVMKKHEELCKDAIDKGLITPQEAEEFKQGALGRDVHKADD